MIILSEVELNKKQVCSPELRRQPMFFNVTLFLSFLDFAAVERVLPPHAAPPHQITLLMCSLNPGCVALAALPCQKNKQTGAHYVIHSAEPFCRVNLQLVLIHLAPRGGSRAVLQLWSKVLSHNLVTSPAAGRPLSRYIVAFHLKKQKQNTRHVYIIFSQ